MPVTIGQPAPAFSLFDSDKKKCSLEGLKGKKILLLFFPAAFTGTCTKELCSVRDNISNYNGLDAQVFGISVDSVYTLAKYREEQQLNFPLLSDFNKEASRDYGSIYETFAYEMRGVSKRSAFIIDREGVIRYAEVLEDATQVPDFEAIRETLEKIA
jgi:peroxiredoxin